MSDDLYPPGPTDVPRHLARPGFDYRLRVAGMIGGLFLFLLIYLALIALAAVFAHAVLTTPIGQGGGVRGTALAVVLKVGGPVAAGLLAVFLVKGLFKGRRVERDALLPLDRDDHPDLFEFVRRVYLDVGADPPRRVYVSPVVNAALIYDSSLLNLVVPPKKDLLVGLGLVNAVNLTEFKAILAHEFGHFAQKSVGIGSYLHVANRAMYDVIYGRDALDRFVDLWAELHWMVAFPALGLKAVLAGARRVLGGLYHGLNRLHLSLGRQMEFNADDAAVRVAGSDAIVHGLARTAFADECLADAARTLGAAADHGLFTDDLFHHQAKAAEHLRRVRRDPRLGLPPDGPGDQVRVFRPDPDAEPDEYSTHPSNDARERNAKRVYVPAVRDDRSPWLLFGPAVRREATELFYRTVLKRVEPYAPRPAAEVQQFIDAEHAETSYDPRYQGWYDDRLINPGDVELPPLKPWAADRITGWLAGWPPPDLGQRLDRLRECEGEDELLRGIGSGALPLKRPTFDYHGRSYTLRDVPRLVAAVEAELNAARRGFADLDRQGFECHWSLAHRLDGTDGGGREAELRERYRFHLTVQKLLADVADQQARLAGAADFWARNRYHLEGGQESQLRSILTDVQRTAGAITADARRALAPGLKNVPAGTSLADLIADRGEAPLPGLFTAGISEEWLGQMAARLEATAARLKRAHFKSLGGLLAYQEELARAWAAEQAAPAYAEVM